MDVVREMDMVHVVSFNANLPLMANGILQNKKKKPVPPNIMTPQTANKVDYSIPDFTLA